MLMCGLFCISLYDIIHFIMSSLILSTFSSHQHRDDQGKNKMSECCPEMLQLTDNRASTAKFPKITPAFHPVRVGSVL